MTNAYGEARSSERATAATFRMTYEEREFIRDQAAKLGLTAQQLFELRMFGQAKPLARAGRKRKNRQTEELPISMSA